MASSFRTRRGHSKGSNLDCKGLVRLAMAPNRRQCDARLRQPRDGCLSPWAGPQGSIRGRNCLSLKRKPRIFEDVTAEHHIGFRHVKNSAKENAPNLLILLS
jgi:hypothetical protein